jgi:hypothetical protein
VSIPIKHLLLLILPGIFVLAAPVAHANPILHPVGRSGDHSVANVRIDISTIDDRYAYSMPDDAPSTICEGLRQGLGETHVVSIAENSGFPHLVAQAAVFSSEFHFCPEYY